MDYSKITLIFRERAKLFTMRFIHPVSAKFIGQDCYNLSHVYKFIYSPYEFTDTLKNEHPQPSVYYLTDNYRRFKDSIEWFAIFNALAIICSGVFQAFSRSIR